MADLTELTLKTASAQRDSENRRRHTVVRTCGEEHTGHAAAGIATVYLPTDPELEYMAQLRFKLILGEPMGANKPVTDDSGTGYPIDKAHSPFYSLRQFYNTFMLEDGTGGVNMDDAYGYQCLTKGAMVLMGDGTYREVSTLRLGEMLAGGNYVVMNEPQLSDVMTVKTNIGDFTSTLTHRLPLENNQLVEAQTLYEGVRLSFDDVDQDEVYRLTDDELLFLGFYLGDGTKHYRWTTSNTPEIFVTVGTDEKCNFLESLDVTLKHRKHSNRKASVYSLVNKNHPMLTALIHQFDGKKLPQNFSARQYRFIIDGYLKADGHKHRRQYVATSTCKELLVSLQHGCLCNGWYAKLTGPEVREKTNLCNRPKPLWRLTVNKNKRLEHVEVESVEFHKEQQTVYVLNITGDHLYYADNIEHHNCWDLADYFWVSNCHRTLQTGPTLGAQEIWTVSRTVNAGSEFSLVLSWNEVKAGDWIVYGASALSTVGHINLALEDTNGGAIRCLGQNQRNANFVSGHVATVDTFDGVSIPFLGAFRYRNWDARSPFSPIEPIA